MVRSDLSLAQQMEALKVSLLWHLVSADYEIDRRINTISEALALINHIKDQLAAPGLDMVNPPTGPASSKEDQVTARIAIREAFLLAEQSFFQGLLESIQAMMCDLECSGTPLPAGEAGVDFFDTLLFSMPDDKVNELCEKLEH